MKKIWWVIEITVKAIGSFFDFMEPYAIALDAGVAWILTLASVAMGLGILFAGGISMALFGTAWFLVGYLLCPAVKMGNLPKAIACGIAVFLLSVLEKYAAS